MSRKALSRRYDARMFFGEAIRDFGNDVPNTIVSEKFELIERTMWSLVGALYGIMGADYMEREDVSAVDDEIDLSSVNIMRTGGAGRIVLTVENASDGVADSLSREAFESFKRSSPTNRGRVVFCYSSNRLLLKDGVDVTSRGKMYLWFPSVPIIPEEDDDKIDLPDGPVIALGIIKLKRLIAPRINKMLGDDSKEEVMSGIRNVLGTYGVMLNEEEFKGKVEAIL